MSMMPIAIRRKSTVRALFVGVFLISFLLLSPAAHADNPSQGAYTTTVCGAPTATASGFVPLACYNGATQFQNAFNSNSLSSYFNSAFIIVLSVGGVLAVLRIVYAGYMYMGSADMWSNKQKAREILGDVIIGVLMLYGTYLIFSTIDPNLLNLTAVLSDIPHPTAPSNCSPSTVGSPGC